MLTKLSKNLSRRDFLGGSVVALLLSGLDPLLAGGLPEGFGGQATGSEGLFGLPREAALEALARLRSRGADFAELFLERRESLALMNEDGVFRDLAWDLDGGVGLRSLKGDTVASGYTQSFDASLVLAAAGDLAAASLQQAGGTGGTLPSLVQAHLREELYQGASCDLKVGLERRVELITRAREAALAVSPLVRKVDVSLVEELREVAVLTSEGRVAVDVQPLLRFNVAVVAQRGDLRQTARAGGGGRRGLVWFEGRSPEAVGREAASTAVKMLDAVPAPSGELVLILAPGPSGVLLHEAVGHPLEADFNRRGSSRYSGRLGQKVASELCTVIDDPRLPGARGSFHFDDEGAPGARAVLIEDGILRAYLQDRISAAHFGVAAGSGRRQSFRHPPIPRMSNTFMAAGQTPPGEIVADCKRGVYCSNFSGGQVNIANGDFVFRAVESYLVEDGKITSPVKDLMIIGNGPDALSRVVAVGNDLVMSDGMWTCGKDGQSVPVGVGIPTVRIDGITMGGAS
jgi:TldD protein